VFGLGFGEILIILVLALILLGPTRLPDAAKTLGKSLREFKKATDDLKSQFEGELYNDHRPARPKLVEPGASSPEAVPHIVPPGGVPAAAAGPAVPATVDNIPGLEAALVDPPPPPQALAPAPAAAPASPPAEAPGSGKAP
jgi:sec-independent protein translocase protein TatB